MLTQADMTHLAHLARLAPDDARLARYSGQCADILRYMDSLAAVDTSGVEPLYSPVEHDAAYRPDEACRRRERAEILAGAPESDGRFFVVPRIV